MPGSSAFPIKPFRVGVQLATMHVLSDGRGFSYEIAGAEEIDAFVPVVAELAGI